MKKFKSLLVVVCALVGSFTAQGGNHRTHIQDVNHTVMGGNH